jgi:hypothetical protein
MRDPKQSFDGRDDSLSRGRGNASLSSRPPATGDGRGLSRRTFLKAIPPTLAVAVVAVQATPPAKGSPTMIPGVTEAEVQDAVDRYQFWHDFHASEGAALGRARARAMAQGALPNEWGHVPYRMVAEDFPERFRDEFDPEVDNNGGDSLGATAIMYADELAAAIAGHSGTPGPCHVFLDARDGRRWLTLPPGLLLTAKPGVDLGLDVAAINGRVAAFPPGKPAVLPATSLDWEKPDSFLLAVDDDGRAHLEPR